MNATSSVVTRCHGVWSYGGVLAAVLLGVPVSGAQEPLATDSADARRIEESVRWAKELGEAARSRLRAAKKVTTKPPPQPSAIAEMGIHVRETRGPDLGNALIYFRAVHAWLARDERRFLDEERKSREAGVFLPGLLLHKTAFFVGVVADNPEGRVAAWKEYGRMAPISLWGTRMCYGIPAGRPADVPLLPSDDWLVKIGDLYAHSGLHEQAVDSYVESVYAIPSVSQDANGRTWLAVGKVETQLGQSQLAIRAYLQAAYYYSARLRNSLRRIPLATNVLCYGPCRAI